MRKLAGYEKYIGEAACKGGELENVELSMLEKVVKWAVKWGGGEEGV